MPKGKKSNRRSNDKTAALKPKFSLKSRADLVDYDYLDKLSPEELDYLSKFTEEYVHDNLDRKNLKNNLHNTRKLKKSCDDMNNARNRCILTKAKAHGDIVYIEDLKQQENKFLGNEELDNFDNPSEDGNNEPDNT